VPLVRPAERTLACHLHEIVGFLLRADQGYREERVNLLVCAVEVVCISGRRMIRC
jgi:hypothetical protein